MSNSQQSAALDDAAHASSPTSRRGKGFLAVCGDLALPGLGHFIAGFRRRGVMWLSICLGIGLLVIIALWVPTFVPAIVVLLPISVLAQLVMLIDAYRAGRKSTREMLRWPVARYAAGIGAIALANFVNPSVRAALWFRDHVAEAFVMPTQSMEPTLIPRDCFLVHKRIAWQRWSLVVFHALDMSGQKYVKRVVGLPGEKVELVGDEVRINDKPVPLPPGLKPYESNPRFPGQRPGCAGEPITLGPGEYYVLGDNTRLSADSRIWGPIPESSLIGVATWTYWPPKHWRQLY